MFKITKKCLEFWANFALWSELQNDQGSKMHMKQTGVGLFRQRNKPNYPYCKFSMNVPTSLVGTSGVFLHLFLLLVLYLVSLCFRAALFSPPGQAVAAPLCARGFGQFQECSTDQSHTVLPNLCAKASINHVCQLNKPV